MKIYLNRPSDDVLGRWALDRFTDACVITLCPPNGPMRDFAADPHVRPTGIPYTFTPDYLWALLSQDQADYERDHPNRAEYVA